MARYELTVSPNYVKDWTLTDATREIFQNAIDQEECNAESEMQYSYDQHCDELIITTTNTTLDKSSLLFGSTSKTDNNKSIGQFGEGYKLALLVLLREGYRVKIYNLGGGEVWTPKFIKSKRYNSEILVIDVEICKSVNTSDLVFSIEGITEHDYNLIKETCLFMDQYNKIDTYKGEILLGINQRSKVFVNGLFICACDNSEIKYGYNLKPQYLTLDRDRSMVSTFDLTWMTSSIWGQHADKDLVAQLILDNVPDVKYLNNVGYSAETCDVTFDLFAGKHGLTAMPVQQSDNLEQLRQEYPGLKQVMVPENAACVIKGSSMYKEYLEFCKKEPPVTTPHQILNDFIAKHRDYMSVASKADFHEILRLSKHWN